MILAVDIPTDVPAGSLLLLVVLGFLVGMAGHVYSLRTLVIAGIFMIFLGTVLMPAILIASA